MATVSATVAAIRSILNDRPVRARLSAAITDTTTETFTVDSGDASLFKVGDIWEHDDANGSTSATSSEQRRITAVNGTLVQAERGYNGSTAATHLTTTYLIKEPRWTYDRVYRALSTVLSTDLLNAGVYEIVEHQVTSSASTNTYASPTSSCERILEVYQRINSGDAPQYLSTWVNYKNVDTAIASTGKAFQVYENRGVPGTATYYVNCVHPLATTTLSTRQEPLVHFGAAAYLLGWEELRRSAGPTNQGDRTVQPGREAQLASYFRAEFQRLLKNEKQYLKRLTDPRREFKPRR